MNVVKGPDSERETNIRRMIDEHQTALLRMCYLYMHDAQLAEDAVQETFIKAIRAWGSFRGESSERTWLTRIAMRTCMDIRRGFWFRRVEHRITPEMLPDRADEAEADESALTVAVMNLPKKEREVVLLYYYQDLTMKEIAETLGVTQPTVSYRLRRAKEKLRTELEGRNEL